MTTRRRLMQGLVAAAALPAAARALPAPAEPAGPDCVFCRIEAGSEDATVLWRDEHLIAIADKFPFTPGFDQGRARNVRPALDAANVYGRSHCRTGYGRTQRR